MEARKRAAEAKAREEEEERRRAEEAAAAKAREIRERRALEVQHAVRIQGTITASRPPEVLFFFGPHLLSLGQKEQDDLWYCGNACMLAFVGACLNVCVRARAHSCTALGECVHVPARV